MNTGLISTRYATALLDYASALGQEKEVFGRMKTLSEVYLQVPQLRIALANSAISRKDKKQILFTSIGGNVPSSLDKMADIILENEREEVVLFIALRYIELYRYKFNIQYGKLITAVPVNKENEEKFISRISSIVGEKLEIEPIVDPDIIGGFILYLNDLRWDASISGELTRIKSKIKKQDAENA
ncbi:MAG: F0F1 ATP synthase subunit delta [Fermentimonas sp.]|nr:F0F1 ATP synthase subunit delta [Fermentimonas sp.]